MHGSMKIFHFGSSAAVKQARPVSAAKAITATTLTSSWQTSSADVSRRLCLWTEPASLSFDGAATMLFRCYGTSPTWGQTQQSSSFWHHNLPNHILGALSAEGTGSNWTHKDWKTIQEVYRRGRSEVHKQDIDNIIDHVSVGIQLLDRMAEQDRLNMTNRAPDKDNGLPFSKDKAILADPWVLWAWGKAAVEEIVYNNQYTTSSLLSSTRLPSSSEMLERIERYLEAKIFAWDPQILSWVLDVWQAEQASLPGGGVGTAPSAKEATKLVERITHEYSIHRPIDKYVVTRLLQILGQKKNQQQYNAPEQANALVEQLQKYAEQREESTSDNHDTDAKNYQLDAHVYSAWAHVWAESKRADAGLQALRILKEAQQDGAAASSEVLYNTVLHALCRSGGDATVLDQAQMLWEELLALKLPVTAASWAPLLRARVQQEHWRAAAQLWRSVERHPQKRLRPHKAARNGLYHALERHVRHWEPFFDNQLVLDQLPETVDWEQVAEQWKPMIESARKAPSHKSLAQALLFLDHLSLAAFREHPSWLVPATDIDYIVLAWRRLSRQKTTEEKATISLNAILRRVRKYQGIGFLRPGSDTLDWMIDGVSKVSSSPTDAAVAAESLLDIAVEDCQYDVNHPDFFQKKPVVRLMQMWASTPEAREAVEAIWEKLQKWYKESGGRKNLEPDEDVYTAILRAWATSSSTTAEETAERALQLWKARLEQAQRKKNGSSPSVMFSFLVAKALAEAGKPQETEALVTKVMNLCQSRSDLDFVSLLVLAHCRAGNPSKAEAFIDEMERRFKDGECSAHFRPSNLSFNILMSSYAEHEEIRDAKNVLERMSQLSTNEPEREIHPIKATWQMYLNSLKRLGK